MSTKTDSSELIFTYGEQPDEVGDREVKGKASPRAEKLIQEYYDAKLMLDCTFPIEYTKAWEENKGRHPSLPRPSFQGSLLRPRACNPPGRAHRNVTQPLHSWCFLVP